MSVDNCIFVCPPIKICLSLFYSFSPDFRTALKSICWTLNSATYVLRDHAYWKKCRVTVSVKGRGGLWLWNRWEILVKEIWHFFQLTGSLNQILSPSQQFAKSQHLKDLQKPFNCSLNYSWKSSKHSKLKGNWPFLKVFKGPVYLFAIGEFT